MNSKELFRRLLGLEDPWTIKEIRFDHQERRINIFIDFLKGSRFGCRRIEVIPRMLKSTTYKIQI